MKPGHGAQTGAAASIDSGRTKGLLETLRARMQSSPNTSTFCYECNRDSEHVFGEVYKTVWFYGVAGRGGMSHPWGGWRGGAGESCIT